MTIKPPVWKSSHITQNCYFTGPMGKLSECWNEGDGSWFANGYGIAESAKTEAEAKSKCEAAYYKWMSEFIDPEPLLSPELLDMLIYVINANAKFALSRDSECIKNIRDYLIDAGEVTMPDIHTVVKI